MVIKDWQYFDLMHATFHPQKMSLRELQMEFYNALRRFYTFRKSFTIMRIYGFGAGMKRLGLWLVFFFTTFISRMVDGAFLRTIKNARQQALPASTK